MKVEINEFMATSEAISLFVRRFAILVKTVDIFLGNRSIMLIFTAFILPTFLNLPWSVLTRKCRYNLLKQVLISFFDFRKLDINTCFQIL